MPAFVVQHLAVTFDVSASMSEFISQLATGVWTPVLFLIILGGLFFLFYSRFVIYRYFGHAINILRGKYDDPNDPGQISAYEARSKLGD